MMTTSSELDERRLDEFERILLSGTAVRVDAQNLWRALAQVFPHRTPGPAERRLLLDALKTIEACGRIRLPPERGKRWDRSMDPAVPTSVDVVRDQAAAAAFPWRTFPWHPNLHWVVQCRSLFPLQVEFLRRVHEGLVNGTFREPAPLKYRSLQLTGDEKMLASFATTSLVSSAVPVQDAEAFGTRRIPDRVEQRHRALDLGCRHGLALGGSELVTQLGHALLELIGASSSSARCLVVILLWASPPPMACSTRLPSWRHRCCSAASWGQLLLERGRAIGVCVWLA
jgi:hypothetical protein